MYLKYCFVFVVLLSTTNKLFSQVKTIDSISQTILYLKSVDSLNETIFNMQKSLIKKSTSDTSFKSLLNKINQIERSFSSLTNISSRKLAQIPTRCKDKLKLDYDNYKDLINYTSNTKNVDSISAIYNFIQEDIILKKNLAWGLNDNPLAGLVKVTVRVLDKQSGKELNGIRVFIKPIYAIAERFIEEFNPTSNAVKDDVSPGKKLIYIEQNGRRAGSRQEKILLNPTGYIYDFIL